MDTTKLISIPAMIEYSLCLCLASPDITIALIIIY